MADEIVYFLRVRHLYFRFARDGLFTRAEDEGELLCLVFRDIGSRELVELLTRAESGLRRLPFFALDLA